MDDLDSGAVVAQLVTALFESVPWQRVDSFYATQVAHSLDRVLAILRGPNLIPGELANSIGDFRTQASIGAGVEREALEQLADRLFVVAKSLTRGGSEGQDLRGLALQVEAVVRRLRGEG